MRHVIFVIAVFLQSEAKAQPPEDPKSLPPADSGERQPGDTATATPASEVTKQQPGPSSQPGAVVNNPYGIPLNPGERLVSVGGVPVNYASVANHVSQAIASPAMTGQSIAQARANYMAQRRYRGHPPRSAGDWSRVGSFEGVGWSSNPNTPHNSIPTCTPRRGMQLVGDAVARSNSGAYRVRIWSGGGGGGYSAPRIGGGQRVQRPRMFRRFRRG